MVEERIEKVIKKVAIRAEEGCKWCGGSGRCVSITGICDGDDKKITCKCILDQIYTMSSTEEGNSTLELITSTLELID